MLVVYILVLLFENTESSVFENRVFQIDTLKNIDDCTDPSIDITFDLNTDSTRKTLVDSVVILKKNFTSEYRMEVVVKKCHNNMPDSCMSFQTLKFPNLCPVIQAKNQLWSPILTKYNPKFACPFTEGTYILKRGFADSTKLPFPMELYTYWKLNLYFIDKINIKRIICVEAGAQLVPMRKEN